MRFIFIQGMLSSTPTHHPLQVLGPVLRGSGPPESNSPTPPPPRRLLPGAIGPRWRFRGRPWPLQPSGLRERRPGSRSSAGDSGVRASDRAPRSPPRSGPEGREPSGAAGPNRGRTAAPEVRASPTPGGDPTSRPRGVRACVRLSVFSLDVSGNFQPGSERVSKTERQRSAPASRGRKRRFRHRSGPATR